MSSHFVLDAALRTDLGKGSSRRLRREGKIPAVIYGAEKEAQSLTMDHDKVLHALEKEAFYSSIAEINIDGKKQKAIIKAVQRHPFKPKVMHVDFQRVSSKVAMHVHVAIHFVGDDVAPGVKEGGVLSKTMTEAEVVCLPADLPEYLEVDLSALEMDGIVHLSDIKLPAGVKLAQLELAEPNNASVASIHMSKVVAEEAPEAEAAEAAEGSDA